MYSALIVAIVPWIVTHVAQGHRPRGQQSAFSAQRNLWLDQQN